MWREDEVVATPLPLLLLHLYQSFVEQSFRIRLAIVNEDIYSAPPPAAAAAAAHCEEIKTTAQVRRRTQKSFCFLCRLVFDLLTDDQNGTTVAYHTHTSYTHFSHAKVVLHFLQINSIHNDNNFQVNK